MEVIYTRLDSWAGLGGWNIPATALLCFSTIEAEKKNTVDEFYYYSFYMGHESALV